MKKKTLNFLFLSAAVLLFFACEEDQLTYPIFYNISIEVEPLDPKINGAPTNFIVYNNAMYVASGPRIYRYTGTDGNGRGIWDTLNPPPGDKVAQIAATSSYLYAWCYKDNDSTINSSVTRSLRRFDGVSWVDITGNTGGIQSIFAAKDTLFIGNQDRSISYVVDAANEITPILITVEGEDTQIKGELTGAVFNGTDYYLCTMGSGIYKMQDPGNRAVLIGTNVIFTGMICLDNAAKTVLLISRDGKLHAINADGNGVAETGHNLNGRLAKGSLAVWENPDEPGKKLLLAGRQDSLTYAVDSGYTYGYWELLLGDNEPNGIAVNASFIEPATGGSSVPTTVDDNGRYKSTIGKYPVNFIFQAPDGILFASTQQNGVWSYRARNDVPQWNAEE